MKRSGSPIGCAVLLAAMAACAPAPPPDTRAADIQAVKDVEAAWAKDAALKDPARMAGYYSSSDATALFPNSGVETGRENIQGAWTIMMRDPNFALTFQNTKAEASKGGDLVYTVGTYSWTKSDPRDKKPTTVTGKYMTVYKKQADGSWKAAAEAMNSDAPAPAERVNAVRKKAKKSRKR